jgi:hypothetical protein
VYRRWLPRSQDGCRRRRCHSSEQPLERPLELHMPYRIRRHSICHLGSPKARSTGMALACSLRLRSGLLSASSARLSPPFCAVRAAGAYGSVDFGVCSWKQCVIVINHAAPNRPVLLPVIRKRCVTVLLSRDPVYSF